VSAPRWIMGVDPGLASCGWAMLRAKGAALEVVAHGCVVTSPEDGDDITRAVIVATELAAVMRAHKPDEVVTEAWRHYKGCPTTKAHALGLVIGAIAATAAREGAAFCEGLRAQDWRVRLGLPRGASKAEAQRRVRAVLGLAKVIAPQHASDAAAVAICHAKGTKR
jgi:crossover junction endodeoxyribonuclease RuvC